MDGERDFLFLHVDEGMQKKGKEGLNGEKCSYCEEGPRDGKLPGHRHLAKTTSSGQSIFICAVTHLFLHYIHCSDI